ncbi:MAG: GNAT family N-acetyltransferase [Anaerolineales bacterium]|nr:GNAT family N-acetyltransferase [Anaerolineales bacterium]NUQ86084.1 GNAT family N-acetyltransferase [Anaerolineales bacterium]
MATKLQTDTTLLDPTLSLRPAQWTDADAVAKLILDVCTHDGDPTVAVTVEELQREWKSPGFVLERDTFVVETPDGRIVGYEEFVNRHAHAYLGGDGYVHPDFMGRGIGTTMLHALEARAHEEMQLADPRLRVFIRNGMSIGDRVSREMHENEGYKAIRFSWRMEITLTDAPPKPAFPDGIELHPFEMAHDHAVYEAHEEAFSDHWGHVRRPYEEWAHRFSERDPSLWHIAWDSRSAEIAGYSLCRYRMGIGWVGTLGVRRAWRKRGLGEALLLHSFGEFHKRGMRTVGLGVDAANPTGATRLYQKAGMSVASEYVIYEKELRPGLDPEEQE